MPLDHIRTMAGAIIVGLGLASTAAQAQVDPYQVTCAQVLSAQSEQERVVANMAVYWAVGYMYGRFYDQPASNLTAERFASNTDDVVNALRQICPNVPDMPIAEFIGNLGNDFERSLSQQ